VETYRRLSMPQQAAHWVHFVVTLILFLVNVLLTHMISKKNFVGRLRYIGHENGISINWDSCVSHIYCDITCRVPYGVLLPVNLDYHPLLHATST
jgi:hypothetical protein